MRDFDCRAAIAAVASVAAAVADDDVARVARTGRKASWAIMDQIPAQRNPWRYDLATKPTTFSGKRVIAHGTA